MGNAESLFNVKRYVGFRMEKLLLYIDPGFLSERGHYKNFAEKISNICKKDNITLKHYVNKKVSRACVKEFGLVRFFSSSAVISSELSNVSVNFKIKKFEKECEKIFKLANRFKNKYDKVVFYMYTAHPYHIQALSKLNKKYNIQNSEIHSVIFYLDNSFCQRKIDYSYINLLNKTNKLVKHQSNFFLHIDSDLAVKLYQPYFDNDIKALPFPLYSDEYIKALEPSESNVIGFKKIGYFGYPTYKHGFDIIIELISKLDDSYNFIIKLNTKMYDKELFDKITFLKEKDNVELHLDYVEDYIGLVRKSDVIIIPYSIKDYPVQTSGVFIDAIVHDKVVFATKNSWMSSKLLALGNEYGCEFDDLSDLVCKIKEVRVSRKEKENELKNFYTDRNLIDRLFSNSIGNEVNIGNKVEKINKRLDNLLLGYEAFTNNKQFIIRRYLSYIKKKARKSRLIYNIDKFIVYPEINNKSILADVLNRLSFALPEKDNIKVYIKTSLCDLTSLPRPQGQGKYYHKNNNFVISKEYPECNDKRIILYDALFIGDDFIQDNLYKVDIIDKSFYSHYESTTLRRIFYTTLDKSELSQYKENSSKNFKNMYKKNMNKDVAYCFTTGPSFDKYSEINIDKKAFKVICNSIIKNTDFIDYIGGADVLVFADPVFHFGVSNYAEKFRQDVLNYVENTPSYIIVPDFTVPLLLHHYPSLKKYLIGIDTRERKEFKFLSVNDLSVKTTANILTLFMIPVASSIAHEVYIMGADGRNPDESYFWKHSKIAQYNTEMDSAFKTHPSFFRDRDYGDYYDEHCASLESLLRYGEKKGKKYRTLTKSFIPALSKRESM